MINCYFNESGYYISGPNIQIYNAVTRHPDIHEVEHLFLVLLKLLLELQPLKLNFATVTIHNDTALVECMNGSPPADAKMILLRSTLRRHIIPSIDANLTFKKISADKLSSLLAEQKSKFLPPVDLTDNSVFQQHHAIRVAKLRKQQNGSNQS
jgi:hypothetical protein